MTMTQDQVLDEFRAAGALLEGHFILSSGLRSGRYLQCARVLMDAARADRLCAALAAKVKALNPGAVSSVCSSMSATSGSGSVGGATGAAAATGGGAEDFRKG